MKTWVVSKIDNPVTRAIIAALMPMATIVGIVLLLVVVAADLEDIVAAISRGPAVDLPVYALAEMVATARTHLSGTS